MNCVHICLVSDRAEANLIPVLQLKPEQVVLLASKTMQAQANALKKQIQNVLPETRVSVESGLPDDSVVGIQGYSYDLAEKLSSDFAGFQVTYNMTGGTKVMSMLMFQALIEFFVGEPSLEVIYTNSANNHIQYLAPENIQDQVIEIESVLTAENYLLANGIIRRRADSDDPYWRQKVRVREGLTCWLANNVADLDWLIWQLNKCISEKNNEVLKDLGRQAGTRFIDDNRHKILDKVPKGKSKQALQRLAEQGLIEWCDEDKYLKDIGFLDLETTRYLHGGWLEEYAWLCAGQVGLEEVFSGQEITDSDNRKDDVRNELDCLAVHKNRMLIVECKTGQLQSKVQDVLARLDNLTQKSSGLFGSKLLLSARPLGQGKDHKRNMSRAANMGIRVLEVDELGDLPRLLQAWRDSGRLPN